MGWRYDRDRDRWPSPATVPNHPERTRTTTPYDCCADLSPPSILATGTAYALINQQTVITLPLALARQGLPAADVGLLFTAAAATTVLAQPLVRLPCATRLTTPVTLALGLGIVLGTQLLAHAGTTALWSAMAAFCLLLAAVHLRVTPESPRSPQRRASRERRSTKPVAAPSPRR